MDIGIKISIRTFRIRKNAILFNIRIKMTLPHKTSRDQPKTLCVSSNVAAAGRIILRILHSRVKHKLHLFSCQTKVFTECKQKRQISNPALYHSHTETYGYIQIMNIRFLRILLLSQTLLNNCFLQTIIYTQYILVTPFILCHTIQIRTFFVML